MSCLIDPSSGRGPGRYGSPARPSCRCAQARTALRAIASGCTGGAQLARGDAVGLLEAAREVPGVGEAPAERDIGDRPRARAAEVVVGADQTAPADVPRDRVLVLLEG